MFTSIEKIKKFLQLEIERKYDNRSVLGGLDKICAIWKQEAIAQGIPLDSVNQICKLLEKYPTLDLPSRQDTIQKILLIITNLQPNNQSIENLIEGKSSSLNISAISKFQNSETRQVEKSNPIYDLESALSNPVIKIPGIGKYRAESLAKLGIQTIKDLIYYFPRKYEDFSNLVSIDKLKFGEKVSIAAEVKGVHSRKFNNGKQHITEIILTDNSGNLRVTFFNQPFLEKNIKTGDKIMVSGRVEMYSGRYVLNNPEWIELDNSWISLNRLYPYYSLTKNITQKWLRKIIADQINLWIPKISDFFSTEFLEKANIIDLQTALKNIHFPSSSEMMQKSEIRFSFQDTFFLHLIMLQQKKSWQGTKAKIIRFDEALLTSIKNNLPYSLTNAQMKSVQDIQNDLGTGIPMSRLIQGDVGSGKTIVAALIIAGVINNGFQSAVLAPTSILAEQLFKNIGAFLLNNKIIEQNEICFLSGDTPVKEKREILDGLKSGVIKIAIGTHALIEEPVNFKNLEFVVIDEQHRFGVMQRKKIRMKGPGSHLLVMTATPIPRTLALTIYGDLDLSIIDELPPGRKEVKTSIINPQNRKEVYKFIRTQAQSGAQAFIVYPRVEVDDDESIETNAAVNEFNRLAQEEFPDIPIGLLHGKMKSEEKENVMTNFRKGLVKILVTTTVIEVGVDIPYATIMLIEGANRFGLSQLHQLRGRVGRNDFQSYCYLIPENEDALENERLKAMVHTNDGFKLAEIDLSQRGPGDFIGIRQSGYNEIRFSNIMNVKIIEKARSLAKEVLDNDPNLVNENSHIYKTIIAEYLQRMIGEKN